ncbi:MAG: YceI family protein [Chitinophagaceae bacterium]|nr:YceI family protein [Chitinophagaceae bacterium]
MQTSTLTTTKWAIDATHSEVQFKVKHLVITTVTGQFKTFSGTVEAENDDFRGAKIEFTADADSLTTGNDARDGHLKSDDFFNAAEYPQLSFKSTDLVKKSNERYVLKGNLTIRNFTKAVELDVEFNGTQKDPFYGKTKAGFEINGKINRKEFGLKWDVLTEAGGAVVSEEVKIHANIQLVKIEE